MTLVDRATLKEMAAAFGLGLMIFTFVLLTNKILRLVELIVNKGVGILTVLQLFLYILPYSLVVTIPMSVLLATLTTFTRFGADGEILALRGAGLSLLRLTRPAVWFGLLATALTLLITIWILPFSNHAFKNLVFQMTQRQAAARNPGGRLQQRLRGAHPVRGARGPEDLAPGGHLSRGQP